ncbi:uncharacterized protein V1518DRAFT_417348 [Limtongia smithiae]|uniref:uncharacterized protein n=1 Tax=Limtongia smithiae TaxID=1125753 RepID=UPI0034CE645A
MSVGLYTFPEPTIKCLRTLRFGSARARSPQARIFEILAVDMTVVEQSPGELYSTLDDLADALPGNSPRYILLSYPMVLPDGRQKTPFVMLYYRPVTATQQAKMLYAGAVELVRSTADVNKLIEIEEENEILEVERLLME